MLTRTDDRATGWGMVQIPQPSTYLRGFNCPVRIVEAGKLPARQVGAVQARAGQVQSIDPGVGEVTPLLPG